MASDLVSIIIPVYNSEKYLKECIDSILSQTYPDIEIIVVDDGSTDSSLDILKQYSDQVHIISQKNNGLASALNLGIDTMKGNWFKWFSPDDKMYPYTISSLVDKAKDFSNDTIIYSNWNVVDHSGNILREFTESDYNHLSNFDYCVRLLDGQQINVNTTLIPSLLLNKITIRKLNDPVSIDYYLFLHLAILHNIKFHLISKPLIDYRIHSSQLSHQNITKSLENTTQIKDEVLSLLSKEKKERYVNQLRNYQKSKSPKKKILALGLQILTKSPSWISNIVIMTYISKIRSNR